jgi:uncharacterized protein (DUF2147 family)
VLKPMSGIFLGALLASSAYAADVTGEWAQADGESKVRFSACGPAICGVLTWLKDPNGPAKLGERVFYDMKPSGEGTWSGKAFNPDDGKEYTGKMSLSGDKLTTAGCVFGGLICKSYQWSRAR